MPSVVFRGASFALRAGEIGFAAVIAGIIGTYVHHLPQDRKFNESLLYATILACISITLGVVWLLPFPHTFNYFPFDFVASIAWFTALGVLIMFGDSEINCDHNPLNWGHITDAGICNQLKALDAFSLLSACFWLGSSLLGGCVVWMERKERKRKANESSKASKGSKA